MWLPPALRGSCQGVYRFGALDRDTDALFECGYVFRRADFATDP
jgi:hypothetical protein